MGLHVRVMPNNTLERTVANRGRFVLAVDCVLGEAECPSVAGCSTSRYAAQHEHARY